MKKDKAWFDLTKDAKRRYAKASWIPLKLWNSVKTGEYGKTNYSDIFEGVHSIAVPLDCREAASNYDWSADHEHMPWSDNGIYHPADHYVFDDAVGTGLRLVLRQSIPGEEIAEWHLHQDFVIALGLQRISDVWTRPAERSIQVARLRRSPDGKPVGLEVRAEYLRDYLCARKSALRMASYLEKDAIVDDLGDIDFSSDGLDEIFEDGTLSKRAWEVEKSGMPYGGGVAVFRSWRTDVDHDDDVPVMGPENDDNTDFEQYSFKREGEKFWRVVTEFRRNEWVEPADKSLRVLHDDVPSEVSFIVEADGTKMNADLLDDEDIGRWLWFQPNVVLSHLAQPGGKLHWYTKDTGGISTPYDPNIHFGINESELVTVYARDIARLPEWERRHWAGFNVTPEGKVSAELLLAQVQAKVADTQSPEQMFWEIRERVAASFAGKFGEQLFRPNEHAQNIASTIHRFRSLDEPGFLALAKDVARLTADAIDLSSLQTIVATKKEERLGSLKTLELVLAQLSDQHLAHYVMGPLFAAYDLRISDAHLPKSDRLKAYETLGIGENDTWMQRGFKLLHDVVLTCYRINAVLTGHLPPNFGRSPA
ncbi:hypothetical protein [Sphingorhabdus sp.]|uniref:hypothetical protein n=1 Tax=Sphingorhabdus sp. TaxID=1902408 RepID=UPI0039833B66